MPLARSFLYVPANREKFLEKAVGLPADAFIFDLEDSVPPAEKQNARAGVREYAPRIPDMRVWVRPNGLGTEFGEADAEAVIGVTGLAGLFVPKVDAREDVLRWDKLIGELEAKRGLTPDSIKLVLSIESARGVLNAYDMSVAAKRTVSLTFGGAQDGDLNTDLGCVWSIDGPEMMHARCHALLAARAPVHRNARRINLVIDHRLIRQPPMQPVTVISRLVARHDANRLAAHCRLRPRRRQARPKHHKVAAVNRVTAHLLRARQDDPELPLRLAQFKRNVNRGILVRGGCVSPIELHHLILQGGMVVANQS
jgi:hypothetical protein